MQNITTFVLASLAFVVAVFGGIAVQQGVGVNEATEFVRGVAAPASPNADIQWPPKLGAEYPDLVLRDLSGNEVHLDRYRGVPLLLEPIGMSCKGCMAFAGGHHVGGFRGMKPQPELKSFKEYLRRFGGGTRLDDGSIESVQILFYGPDGRTAPTLEEANEWAQQYCRYSPTTTVLFADQAMIRPGTKAMIPGFQLIDRNFVLRSDAGNPPKEDVFRTLIPMMRSVASK
jgi:hypothetical protein